MEGKIIPIRDISLDGVKNLATNPKTHNFLRLKEVKREQHLFKQVFTFIFQSTNIYI